MAFDLQEICQFGGHQIIKKQCEMVTYKYSPNPLHMGEGGKQLMESLFWLFTVQARGIYFFCHDQLHHIQV